MPTPFNPTSEAHYLTVDGDVLDNIGWMYYRREQGVTEALLKRNPWLSHLSPLLPAGLILVLPVLSTLTLLNAATARNAPVNSAGVPMRQLWNYRVPKLWKGGTVVSTNDSDAAALAALRATQVPAATVVAAAPDCCEEIHNPLEFSDFEWLAIYYRDTDGKWKLGRVHKSSVAWNTDGYGTVIGDPLGGGLL